MHRTRHWIRALACVTALIVFANAPAQAGPGHDHGEEASPAVAAEVAPRLSAMSDRHEMVALVDGQDLVIWINEFASSAPVTTATVDVTIDGNTARADPMPDGTYHVPAGPLAGHAPIEHGEGPEPLDQHAVLVAVTTPAGQDLLTGALSHDHEHHEEAAAFAWPWALLGVLVLAGMAGALVWRNRRRTAAATAGAGALLAALSLSAPPPAQASPGHDHGEAAEAPVGGDVARRLPDGDLFVPMAVQRTLGVRTLVAEQTAAGVAISLNGRVIADPNAGGVVQPTTAGRVMPPPGGFPALGARVSAGQILAYVEPAIEGADRAGLAQEAAAIETELATAQAQLARLERLEGVVPQREIEEARLAVQGLERRRAATAGGRAPREALRAPVAGVIAMANVQAGAVVEGRTVLFEVINPGRLQIEATITDDRPLGAAATALVEGRSIGLTRIGTGRTDAAGASVVRFAVTEGAEGLRLNQPVTVFAETAARADGVAIPRAAIVRAANGQSVVFVKEGPERMAQRVVVIEPVGADTVIVTAGVTAGERVVTEGAQLLAQIR
jgi:biotin carboxyl carrier protein